ncbi:hypothetical protein BESB_059980 [Besnoitia besnoiti]|uniref:Phosphoglycerate mutase family protein n=1 Tax=Besnoitia besnoiti TaxID=94643 RepID=A0A2A9MFT1_BESBE|nr:hypothetical protein BESB_059980 [Besnoitia besnoiti]PFH35111.1 hypothetical protein BESB_059980 [Besnoitia besnoiti]
MATSSGAIPLINVDTFKRVLGLSVFAVVARPLWKWWAGPVVKAIFGKHIIGHIVCHRIRNSPEQIFLVQETETEVHLCGNVTSGTPDHEIELTPEGSMLQAGWRKLFVPAEESSESSDKHFSGRGHWPSMTRVTEAVCDQPTNGEFILSSPRVLVDCDTTCASAVDSWKAPYEITEDMRLRDQEMGFGRSRTELVKEFLQRNFEANKYYRFSGGESGADVFDRVASFGAQLQRDFETKPYVENCVIVSHRPVLRVLISLLSPKTADVDALLDLSSSAGVVVLKKKPPSGEYEYAVSRAFAHLQGVEILLKNFRSSLLGVSV